MNLRDTLFLADTHQEILDAYVYEFLFHEEAVLTGRRPPVFDSVYLPKLKAQGVGLVNMSVGGDHVAQIMYSASDLRFWDANKKLDVLNSELEAGCESFVLCRTAADLDAAVESGRIAVIAAISGGRPLEGKPNLNLLSSLRNLHRLGLRSLQLTGNGRNRLGDGCGQARTRGRLSDYGAKVVQEAGRLGMIIDTAQLADPGFRDVLELHDGPVIDSHTCASALCDHPRNISDERIRAIAERDGIIGVSFRAALVNQNREAPDVSDLIRQIRHIAEVAGVEHVALGPDYCAYSTPVRRDAVRGYANLGPDFCEFDDQTPSQSEKNPGFIAGVWYGLRKSDFVQGPNTHESFGQVLEALSDAGFPDEDIAGIAGRNYLQFCRRNLPEA